VRSETKKRQLCCAHQDQSGAALSVVIPLCVVPNTHCLCVCDVRLSHCPLASRPTAERQKASAPTISRHSSTSRNAVSTPSAKLTALAKAFANENFGECMCMHFHARRLFAQASKPKPSHLCTQPAALRLSCGPADNRQRRAMASGAARARFLTSFGCQHTQTHPLMALDDGRGEWGLFNLL
jgi:hypothetical protein